MPKTSRVSSDRLIALVATLSLIGACERAKSPPQGQPGARPGSAARPAPPPSRVSTDRRQVWTLVGGELAGLHRLRGAAAGTNWVSGAWGQAPRCTRSYPCYSCSSSLQVTFFANGHFVLERIVGGRRCAPGFDKRRPPAKHTLKRPEKKGPPKPAALEPAPPPAAAPAAGVLAAAPTGVASQDGRYRVLDARRVELRSKACLPRDENSPEPLVQIEIDARDAQAKPLPHLALRTFEQGCAIGGSESRLHPMPLLLRPGDYTLELESRGYRKQRVELKVVAGERRKLRLTLQRVAP